MQAVCPLTADEVAAIFVRAAARFDRAGSGVSVSMLIAQENARAEHFHTANQHSTEQMYTSHA